MKVTVVSVFDFAAKAFMQPMFMPSVGSAIRSFSDEVNKVREGNIMNAHPEDFVLYELGTYEDEFGRFELLQDYRVIASGKDVKVTKV